MSSVLTDVFTASNCPNNPLMTEEFKICNICFLQGVILEPCISNVKKFWPERFIMFVGFVELGQVARLLISLHDISKIILVSILELKT